MGGIVGEWVGLCACGRPAFANGRECGTCFRERLSSITVNYAPTKDSDRRLGRDDNQRFDRRLERYRAARMEGSQPATTRQHDVDAALAWSDEHQKPFRADTEGRMREAS